MGLIQILLVLILCVIFPPFAWLVGAGIALVICVYALWAACYLIAAIVYTMYSVIAAIFNTVAYVCRWIWSKISA